MKKCWSNVLLLLCICVAGCTLSFSSEHDDLAKLNWQPIDSVYAYYIVMPGEGDFKRGNLLGVELAEIRKRADSSMADSGVVDAELLMELQNSVTSMLNNNPGGFLKKNAEGFIKVKPGAAFYPDQFKLTALLNSRYAKSAPDELISYLKQLPAVTNVRFISADEAKKKWIDDGEVDFTEFLDENPLPSSLEIEFAENYIHEDSVKNFTGQLTQHYSTVVQNIGYAETYLKAYRAALLYFYIYRYKT